MIRNVIAEYRVGFWDTIEAYDVEFVGKRSVMNHRELVFIVDDHHGEL